MQEFTYLGTDACVLYATTVGSGGSPLLLLHAGGPDHQSLLPLAHQFADRYTVILPDIRGYGRSVCVDPARHTWDQYGSDVIALLDHLGFEGVTLAGTGLGGTVTLRTAMRHPDRVHAAIVIGVEDIQDDEAHEAEAAFLDAFAARVLSEGIEAAWAPILEQFPPIVGALVREAIPRADPASVAAAAYIGHDRAFRSLDDLAAIRPPTLVIPGTDPRHPLELATQVAEVLRDGHLAPVTVSADLRSIADLAPAIRTFLNGVRR